MNVSNLQKPLALLQKFAQFFKGSLRPSETLAETPLVEIREIYASHVGQGVLDRSRGLSRKSAGAVIINVIFEEESNCNLLFEYDLDDPINDPS
ncbi:hypothetical protein CFP56_024535 [Quercus suber]|uniref:Uncharacterized protein n=1 Tax=Quercus suber TaxID=58331 RepID=A0AAW0LX37_QUESU